MIEIHCHLLPNIDDGVTSFEESIQTISQMKQLGYEKIIITPHYIHGTKYNCNNKEKLNLLDQLKNKLQKKEIDVELYLGNEVFIDEDLSKHLDEEQICTINNSRYLFIELPRNDQIVKLNDIIFGLKNKNITPILAHPERYSFIKEDVSLLEDLIHRGVLLQVNFESINGKYGKEAKKVAQYIFKNNLASFIGGDVHHENSLFFKDYEKTKKKIIKIIKEEKWNELINENPQKVIENKEIKVNL